MTRHVVVFSFEVGDVNSYTRIKKCVSSITVANMWIGDGGVIAVVEDVDSFYKSLKECMKPGENIMLLEMIVNRMVGVLRPEVVEWVKKWLVNTKS